jgi:transcriptional regulator with XRE-family HTH domain
MIDPLDVADPRTLKAARLARGLSIADLSRSTGVLYTTILRIETEDNDPRTRTTWTPLVNALQAAPLVAAA